MAFGLNKDEILSLTTTQMDLEGIALRGSSQTGRDKYEMVSLLVEFERKEVELIETRSRMVVAGGWGKGTDFQGRDGWVSRARCPPR